MCSWLSIWSLIHSLQTRERERETNMERETKMEREMKSRKEMKVETRSRLLLHPFEPFLYSLSPPSFLRHISFSSFSHFHLFHSLSSSFSPFFSSSFSPFSLFHSFSPFFSSSFSHFHLFHSLTLEGNEGHERKTIHSDAETGKRCDGKCDGLVVKGAAGRREWMKEREREDRERERKRG